MTDQPSIRRRHFRFRLRTLLLLPVLFAVGWLGWWWITWPERTAERFVALLLQRDLKSARRMSDLPHPFDMFWTIAKSENVFLRRASFLTPSWPERIIGQRSFTIVFSTSYSSPGGDLRAFVAQAGRVSLSPSNGGNLCIDYRLRRIPADAAAEALVESGGFTNEPTDPQFVANVDSNRLQVTVPDGQHSAVYELLKKLGEPVLELSAPTSQPREE